MCSTHLLKSTKNTSLKIRNKNLFDKKKRVTKCLNNILFKWKKKQLRNVVFFLNHQNYLYKFLFFNWKIKSNICKYLRLYGKHTIKIKQKKKKNLSISDKNKNEMKWKINKHKIFLVYNYICIFSYFFKSKKKYFFVAVTH